MEEIKPEKKFVGQEEILCGIIEKIVAAIKLKRCFQDNCGDILVVDDNEFNRYLLVQLLTKYGLVCNKVKIPIFQK